MKPNHLYRHPQSSVRISMCDRTKLLPLLILLMHVFIRNSEAYGANPIERTNQRRQLQQSSGRQSDTSDCVLNSYGVYGTIDMSETSTTNNIYNIEYLYQVSVTSGTTTTQFTSDIIRPLDSVITTAILPSFFPNCQNKRFLQAVDSSGVNITAISSTPVDSYVPSGLPCPKIVTNTDCYVVQGLSTVIGTGVRDDDYVQATFQFALQSVLQNNAIVPLLASATNVVIDVSALTDDLEVSPPINIQPQAPISSPIPVPIPVPLSTNPITDSPLAFPVAVPAPTRLTFAPIPDIVNFPTVNIFDPTISPTAAAPNSELPSRVPSKIPTTTNGTTTIEPVNVTKVPLTNGDDENREQQSKGKEGLKWWAWLLIVFGAITVAFCGYGAYLNQRDGTTNDRGRTHQRDAEDGGGAGASRIGMLTSNPKINVQAIKRKNSSKKGTSKGTRDTEDEDDENDEEVPYEPPMGMDEYVPPPTMTLNNTTNKNSSSDNILTTTPADDNEYAATGLPTMPYFNANAAPNVVTPIFVNNALDDESDDDEDEDEHIVENDDDDDDEEIEYENDGYRDEEVEYTDEGDDDEEEVEEQDQRGYENHHQDGEVFEDEESYYEEEEDEDDEDNTYGEDSYPPRNNGQNDGGGNNNHDWGEPSSPPSFGGLY